MTKSVDMSRLMSLISRQFVLQNALRDSRFPCLQCTRDHVIPLTEAQCGGRSHAFRIDFMLHDEGRSKRYKTLLAADTAADYTVWTERINEALRNIGIWQSTHTMR